MGSANFFAFFSVLFLLLHQAAANGFLAPLLSPIFDDVCKEVECGKGKCKASSNASLVYECECDSGWKQISHHLKFLPCVIPNCTINVGCGQEPSPDQQRPNQNTSLFDPCHWTDCGGGVCNKTSPFTYNCVCQTGYSNLLNTSSFACLKECAVGMDCKDLGITVQNASTSPNTALPENGKNQGSHMNGDSSWLIVLTVSLFAILRI